jgi:serine/threonine protein kinase
MHWTREVRRHHCLAIDLLGDSIETIKDRSGGRISVKDGLLLGMQMLEALRFMHSRAIIHRDIKSDNIVIGLGKKQNVLFLIDYGLAKQYCNPKTQEHIPYRENKCLTGTPRFASINNHLGIEQSRRDDIEALAYVIVYLIKGILPWQGIKIPKHIKDARKYKNKKILDSKMTITTQELCRGVPRCVEIMLQEARALRFQDKPPY